MSGPGYVFKDSGTTPPVGDESINKSLGEPGSKLGQQTRATLNPSTYALFAPKNGGAHDGKITLPVDKNHNPDNAAVSQNEPKNICLRAIKKIQKQIFMLGRTMSITEPESTSRTLLPQPLAQHYKIKLMLLLKAKQRHCERISLRTVMMWRTRCLRSKELYRRIGPECSVNPCGILDGTSLMCKYPIL